MKLFLSSSGLRINIYEKDFLKLLDKPANQTRVAFIPTAADPEDDKSYVQKSIDELKEIGITEIEEIDLKYENEKSLMKRLSKTDVIYVNGGNTFYLLQWVRKSGFDKVVKNLLKKGKIYFGTSAGSYIACPTIEMATWQCGKTSKKSFTCPSTIQKLVECTHQDRNKVGMKDFKALNLVPFLITAHYTDDYKEIVEKESKKIKYTVIALRDNQAIVVKDEKYEIIGKGKKIVFNNMNSK